MLHNTKLINELKKKAKQYPAIEDIILFGSFVRGKTKPQDVDVLLIFQIVVDKEVEYTIRKVLEKFYPNLSLLSKTIKTVQDPAFDARESILFEGISLLDGVYYCSKYGFSARGMFRYEFKNWSSLQRTKFYHAFNGRRSTKGIVDRTQSIKLSDKVVLVPVENIELFKEFLESWGLEYRYIPLLLPKRLDRKDLLMMV